MFFYIFLQFMCRRQLLGGKGGSHLVHLTVFGNLNKLWSGAIFLHDMVGDCYEYCNLQCKLRNFALCHLCVEMQRNSYTRKDFTVFVSARWIA